MHAVKTSSRIPPFPPPPSPLSSPNPASFFTSLLSPLSAYPAGRWAFFAFSSSHLFLFTLSTPALPLAPLAPLPISWQLPAGDIQTTIYSQIHKFTIHSFHTGRTQHAARRTQNTDEKSITNHERQMLGRVRFGPTLGSIDTFLSFSLPSSPLALALAL